MPCGLNIMCLCDTIRAHPVHIDHAIRFDISRNMPHRCIRFGLKTPLSHGRLYCEQMDVSKHYHNHGSMDEYFSLIVQRSWNGLCCLQRYITCLHYITIQNKITVHRLRICNLWEIPHFQMFEALCVNKQHAALSTAAIEWEIMTCDFLLDYFIASKFSCKNLWVRYHKALINALQELIRRWDSEREHFTTISHTYFRKRESTSFNKLDDS